MSILRRYISFLIKNHKIKNEEHCFNREFCDILYKYGKLCKIDGSSKYHDKERTLINDITPINGSFPGYHTIELSNGIVIEYCRDYYNGSKRIYRREVTYKGELIPENIARKYLKYEYDFFKSLYESERLKRDKEILNLNTIRLAKETY